MKRLILLFLILTISACVAQPVPAIAPTENLPFIIKQEDNSYAPPTDDTGKQRGEVILTSINLSERFDLAPIQNELRVLGSMPGTCSELRIVINPPNETYQIHVEVYSVVDPILKCENVFQQFDATILLGLYSAGRYTIWVNDAYIGDFVSL